MDIPSSGDRVGEKRARDAVWDHVDELTNSCWRCRACGRFYAGGPTMIRAHIDGIPGQGIPACTRADKRPLPVSSKPEAPPANSPSDSESGAEQRNDMGKDKLMLPGPDHSPYAVPSSHPSISKLSSVQENEGEPGEVASCSNLSEHLFEWNDTGKDLSPYALLSTQLDDELLSIEESEEVPEEGVHIPGGQVFLTSIMPQGSFASRLRVALLAAGIIARNCSQVPYDSRQQAMERSGIWMPLIGEDYMSAPNCLDELQYMLNAWKLKPEKVILPIFYGVKPTDIMLEKGPFERAMSRICDSSPEISTLESWKEALKVVSRVSGWVISERCSKEILHLIAREVSSITSRKIPREGPYFVGIDRKVEHIMNLLNVEVNDRRIVAISGVGGVGKTTLAKAVYSRLSPRFEGCCFLSDIREMIRQRDHCLQYLQTKLISTILKRKCEEITVTDEGISYMREVFGHMNVLIVLDGVDACFHLEDLVEEIDTFGPGSRIIVTSRYASDHLGVYQTYEVPELSQWEVQQLFSRYVNAKFPPLDKFASEIVSVVGAIPLVVEVIGSFLFGKGDTVWKETLQKLNELPHEEVQKKLLISYEALDAAHKQIYLDVACSVSGQDRRIASYMWNDLSTSPFSGGIEFRHFGSPVKVGDNGELWMHDELQKLGRQLIRQGGFTELNKDKRLCSTQGDSNTRDGAKGKEKVGVGFGDPLIDYLLEYRLTGKEGTWSKRFLNVNHAKSVAFHARPNLRWLQFYRRPIEDKYFPKNLFILDISWSSFTETWEGWGQIKMLKALKVLNLTGCNNLVTTPDFSGYPDLEVLILEQCGRLVKIHPSISHLKMLVSLNLNFCSELSNLPKELGSMRALKELLIDGTSLQEIPTSIGHIETLETLSASGCLPFNKLPASIGCLKSLLVLSLDHTRITEIPSAVKELVNLQKLSLRNCRLLGELPIAFGAQGLPLCELDVSGTGISELPDSIGNLHSLRVLKVEFCFITEFPLTILQLQRLEEINASYCRNLSEFIQSDSDHVEIYRLESLKILRLGSSNISRLPANFRDLPSLETLDLRHCDMLRILPDLPRSLTSLQYSCKVMNKPSLRWLNNLEEVFLADREPEGSDKQETGFHRSNFLPDEPQLQASNSKDELSLVGNSKLRTLELRLSFITSIHFPADCSYSVRKVVLSCVKLSHMVAVPPSLVNLSLQHCSSLELLNIGELKALEELQMDHSTICEITGLHELEALVILEISNCKVEHLEGLEKLTSLRSLTISHCDHLRKLPDMSNLKMLRVLDVRDCKMIDDIQSFR